MADDEEFFDDGGDDGDYDDGDEGYGDEDGEAAAFGLHKTIGDDGDGQKQNSDKSRQSPHAAMLSSLSTGVASVGAASGFGAAASLWVSLSCDDVRAEMTAAVSKVRDVTGMDEDAAWSILWRSHWDPDSAIERFVDNPDESLAQSTVNSSASSSSAATFSCPICLDDFQGGGGGGDVGFSLSCGHWHCSSCWKEYLASKLSGGTIVNCRCPAPKCTAAVPRSVISRSLSSADQQRRVADAEVRAYISAASGTTHWCPGRGCGTHVIRVVPNAGLTFESPVVCKGCGLSYCWVCSDADIGDHRPSTCAQARAWIDKAADESENLRWMTANTKRCPKCRLPVEKNGGCMHMTCRKEAGGCGHEWCWLCRGDWKTHGSATGGFYACNKYDKSAAKKEDAAATEARTELERYGFYYHRYEAHKKACSVALGQLKKAMEQCSTVENRFIVEAMSSLVECRRTLEHSYVFGYNLGKSAPQRLLFEYLQENLEKMTDHLASLVERWSEPDGPTSSSADFPFWREDVTNTTRVTLRFLANFNRGVAGGLAPVGSVVPATTV